jgi:class 3 adenylate cyclase
MPETLSTSNPAIRTLLLCDLVASTQIVERQIVERVGDSTAADLLARHDRFARDLLSTFNGREIDKSDGFLLLFERPIEAVRFAVAYQAKLREFGATFHVPMASRVGIHLGEVVIRKNSPEDVARGAKPLEVEGLAKAVAARIMSLAGDGRGEVRWECRMKRPCVGPFTGAIASPGSRISSRCARSRSLGKHR